MCVVTQLQSGNSTCHINRSKTRGSIYFFAPSQNISNPFRVSSLEIFFLKLFFLLNLLAFFAYKFPSSGLSESGEKLFLTRFSPLFRFGVSSWEFHMKTEWISGRRYSIIELEEPLILLFFPARTLLSYTFIIEFHIVSRSSHSPIMCIQYSTRPVCSLLRARTEQKIPLKQEFSAEL